MVTVQQREHLCSGLLRHGLRRGDAGTRVGDEAVCFAVSALGFLASGTSLLVVIASASPGLTAG